MKAITRGLLITIALVTALVGFQNCSPIRFETLEPPFILKNNGAGYGGKSREYYRFVPEHTCEGHSAPKAVLEVGVDEITLTENKLLQCGMRTSPLDPATVDTSPFQNTVVGYKEGIFELKDTELAAIPNELVEAWCRDGIGDGSSDGAIETITHYDRVAKRAVTELLYQSSGSLVQAPSFDVGRLVSQSRVEFANDRGFRLIIDRKRPTAVAGIFEGDLMVVIAGRAQRRKVGCRLGGALDPSVWPSRILADFDVYNVKLSPDLTSFGYISTSQTGQALLYTSRTDGSGHGVVTPMSPGSRGASEFVFTPDSRHVVFTSDLEAPYLAELYRSPVLGGTITRLSEKASVPGFNQYVDRGFVISTDGSRVIYRDGLAESMGDIKRGLMSVPLAGGAPALISSIVPEAWHPYHANSFAVSSNGQRVVFLGSGSTPRLLSAAVDGLDLKDISPAFMTFSGDRCTGWCIQLSSPLVIPSGTSYVVVSFKYLLSTGAVSLSSGTRTFAISLDGTWMTELGGEPLSDSHSSDGSYLLLKNWDDAIWIIQGLFDGRSWKFTSPPRGYFSADSRRYVGLSTVSADVQRVVSVSLTTGEAEALCSGGSTSTAVAVAGTGADGESLVLNHDRVNRLLRASVSDSSGTCREVTTVPLGDLSFMSTTLKVAPDKKAALVRLNLESGGSELLYLPLDGRPPYSVAAPTSIFARVRQFSFLADSRFVLYEGDQTEPDILNLYLWTAPEHR